MVFSSKEYDLSTVAATFSACGSGLVSPRCFHVQLPPSSTYRPATKSALMLRYMALSVMMLPVSLDVIMICSLLAVAVRIVAL